MHSHSSTTNGKNPHLWILDTGENDHISYDINVFINCKNIIHVHVNLHDGSYIVASMYGSVVISPSLKLYHVFYILSFHVNLISIVKPAINNDYFIHFGAILAKLCRIIAWK